MRKVAKVAALAAVFVLGGLAGHIVPVRNANAVSLSDRAQKHFAVVTVKHLRPVFDKDGHPMVDALGKPLMREISSQKIHNTITTVGRDFIHTQSYGTSPAANGLNWIALSNDSLTENSASTTLSNEIAANGLTRAQGTVVHNTSATTTTVSKTFTCSTSSQAAQKAALFTASSSGTMNHVLAFTQRTLQVGDQLAITFTITIS